MPSLVARTDLAAEGDGLREVDDGRHCLVGQGGVVTAVERYLTNLHQPSVNSVSPEREPSCRPPRFVVWSSRLVTCRWFSQEAGYGIHAALFVCRTMSLVCTNSGEAQ
jgi:hypothetical protein